MHRNFMTRLLGSTAIVRNWDSESGGGDNDFENELDESQQDDEITLAGEQDALDALYEPEEGKEDETDDENQDEDETFPTQDEVTADLKANLEAYTIPEDLIPEDTDWNDPRARREALTTVTRHAVTQSLALMFKPIQIAMQQQQSQLRKEMRDSVKTGFSADKEEQVLAEMIPAITDRAQSKVIRTLYAQAKLKHPKDVRAAATATRDAFKALGGNPNGRKTRSSGGGNGLANYAPLPELNKPTRQNQDRLRRSGNPPR